MLAAVNTLYVSSSTLIQYSILQAGSTHDRMAFCSGRMAHDSLKLAFILSNQILHEMSQYGHLELNRTSLKLELNRTSLMQKRL